MSSSASAAVTVWDFERSTVVIRHCGVGGCVAGIMATALAAVSCVHGPFTAYAPSFVIPLALWTLWAAFMSGWVVWVRRERIAVWTVWGALPVRFRSVRGDARVRVDDCWDYSTDGYLVLDARDSRIELYMALSYAEETRDAIRRAVERCAALPPRPPFSRSFFGPPTNSRGTAMSRDPNSTLSVWRRGPRTVLLHRNLHFTALILATVGPLVPLGAFFAFGFWTGLACATASLAWALFATFDLVFVRPAEVVVWRVFAGVPYRRHTLHGDVTATLGEFWDDLYGDGDEVLLRAGSTTVTFITTVPGATPLLRELTAALARARVPPPSRGIYR